MINVLDSDDENETHLVEIGSVEVHVYRADDGVIVVCVDSYAGADENADGTPRVRVRVNDALLHHEDGRCSEVSR